MEPPPVHWPGAPVIHQKISPVSALQSSCYCTVRGTKQKSVSDLWNFWFGFLSDLYNEQKM